MKNIPLWCDLLSSGKARAIPYALTLATIGIFLAFDTLDDQRRLISGYSLVHSEEIYSQNSYRGVDFKQNCKIHHRNLHRMREYA